MPRGRCTNVAQHRRQTDTQRARVHISHRPRRARRAAPKPARLRHVRAHSAPPRHAITAWVPPCQSQCRAWHANNGSSAHGPTTRPRRRAAGAPADRMHAHCCARRRERTCSAPSAPVQSDTDRPGTTSASDERGKGSRARLTSLLPSRVGGDDHTRRGVHARWRQSSSTHAADRPAAKVALCPASGAASASTSPWAARRLCCFGDDTQAVPRGLEPLS